MSHRLRPMAVKPTLDELNYDHASKRKVELLGKLKPKNTRMAPVHSKYASRLESLRTSPYMFFHGESSDYSEAVHAREEEQKAWMTQVEAKHQLEKKSGGNAVFGYSLVTAPPPPIPLLVDNIFDDLNSDGFAGGTVLRTTELVRLRRKKLDALRSVGPSVEELPPCLVTVRRILLKCAAIEGPSAAKPASQQAGWTFNQPAVPGIDVPPQDVQLNVGMLKQEFRYTFDIQCDSLLELFFREVALRPPGKPAPEVIDFSVLFALLETYMADGEEMRHTIESCFKLVDFKKCDNVSLNQLREFRGKPQQAMPQGLSFAMLMATINVMLHREPEPALTLSLDEFAALFATSDELAVGFMEEVLRHILVKRFGHDRVAIAAFYKRE